MPNITFSVDEKLYTRMKKFPEIKWSTLYRQTIERFLDKFENPNVIPITELRERLKKKGIIFDDIPIDKAIELFKRGREVEWERTFSTQID
ncbi:MAG: hypothetical protein ACTSR8_04970 [Promethearchaeota archaeon]